MKFFERQKKIEEKVFDTIEEISDEIGLDIPYYPEVYWLGKYLLPESLSLPESENEELEDIFKRKASCLLTKYQIILIGRDHPLVYAEEAGHFLHRTSSKFKYSGRTIKDNLAVKIIDEMIGYFSSKLIVPNRVNLYESFTLEEAKRKFDKEFDEIDYHIYREGYGLGERLYLEYISNSISKEEIKDLFTSPMSKKDCALRKFKELKERFNF